MPQLSLYLDEKTLRKLEVAAGIEHLSISRYAVKILNESMYAKWPECYGELFGAIDDATFTVEKERHFDYAGNEPTILSTRA